MTAGGLGEEIGLTGAAVTALIDRLENAGYVVREQYFETTLSVPRRLAQSATELYALCSLMVLAREMGDRDREEALLAAAAAAAGPDPELLTVLPLRRQTAELLLSGGDGRGAATDGGRRRRPTRR